MAKLGSKKRPAVIRVRDEKKAEEILALCSERGWECIAGVELGEPEDISDFERLAKPVAPAKAADKPGRNDPCPCGSGKKYKKCCGA